ncbi:hypothetical protein SGQ83_12690 [Flavobacterium sp. Fl-318]|jgi:hypothetical protein|uniref:Adenylosuccinate lyase n=1 Tax=Flavobacterium cupriresistens TaxID=2893885 RepID=A0ABU4RD48_9FLAO|nr:MULTISPECIES: hypothetical protein [unclassified Flavobacterium]MDX6190211.1 hypothetical protein [Flavobacterium sp. Fl-318]UFH43029.1 hypothetical protein LNP23_02140 [Flavobacterium sp. F-323]
MSSELQSKLNYLKAYRENRLKIAQDVLENKDQFKELLSICFSPLDKNNHKACWILEFVSYEELIWLQSHLDFFCSNLKILKDESAIRPIAKIVQLLVKSHYKKNENSILLSEENLQDCIEASFDWLINDTKVAAKAYSIRTLYVLGNHHDWIHPELQIILNKDYAAHSAAYKAVAREVLTKIK